MLKRFAIVAFSVLVVAPGFALADDATPTPSAAPSPAAQSDAASAAGLGPQSTDSVGSSSATGGQLQPAGTALQASPTDSNGLSAASSNNLQAPAGNSDQLKVLLSGEADGAPQNMDDTSGLSGIDDVILSLVLLGLVIGFLIRRRQLAAAHRRYPLS